MVSSLSSYGSFLPIFSMLRVETAIDSQGLRVEIAAGVSVKSAESQGGVAKQAAKQAI